MRKSFLMICCAAILVAAGGSQSLAEDSEFKISDYIPQKFQDFEWKVNGNFGLNDYDMRTASYSPQEYWPYSVQTNDRSNWSGGLTSDVAYRFETVPRFLYSDLSIGGFLTNLDEKTSRDRIGAELPDGEQDYLYRSESNIDGMNFNIAGRADAGQYLSGDFFASIGTYYRFYYSETPDASSYSYRDEVEYYEPWIRRRIDETTSESSDDLRDIDLSLALLPGWGRLYTGDYASTAMYIIEELRNNGLLLREPTHDEMLQLCDIVYQNRLEHSIDKRIRKIESLDAIMGYLRQAGLSDDDGCKAHLLVQDVWDYFPRHSRAFGFRARLGPGFDLSYYRRRSTTDTYSYDLYTRYDPADPGIVDTAYDISMYEYYYYCREIGEYDLYAKGIVEYSRPLSRQWQLDLLAAAKYYFSSHVTSNQWDVLYRKYDDGSTSSRAVEGDEDDIDRRYRMELHGYGTYIVDSRTELGFFAGYTYECLKADADSDVLLDPDIRETSRKSLELQGTFTYRISIPTSLNVYARYEHNRPYELYWIDIYNESTSDRYSIGVSLDHYLY